MLKSTIYVCALILLLTKGILAQTVSDGDKIIGIWLTEDKDGTVEIYKSGNVYYGKLLWGTAMYEADGTTPRKDLNNANPKLRTRLIKNLVFLTGLVYNGSEWTNGEIYNSLNGKTYSCNAQLVAGKLNIHGYVGIPLFGKTIVWTRVK